ncbi:Golgi apparatus membrane protein TVP23 [Lentinus brumalis]|uniref:Golgi apparatus membrane protein TVP23 n=1 Tax=Lentinus brumalis TaxID=2498619 RepID=A0A371DTP6_9APHY|nr:Golgi apparatus membrane protein TVP23 [Polyporus brumalis]
MSSSTPLFDAIEPDDPEYERRTSTTGNISSANATQTSSNARPPAQMATNPGDAESGIAGILRQSAHPAVLFCLYCFRIAAIAVYILGGLFISNYVLSSVIVVVLLAMDFWNCRNVAGRRLVGLRYWNQVDDDGESYWVFESRDPSRPANPIDSKMFWIAVYTFPLLWLALLIVSILKFNLSFVPIVALALVFNVTNAIGFTYADRDAKEKWANNLASSGWNMGMGGIGGQLLTGVVKNSVGRVFGSGH